MGLVCIILFLDHSPPLYHAYSVMTVFLWTQIFSEYQFLNALWRYLLGRENHYIIKLLATSAVSVFILEILVCCLTNYILLLIKHCKLVGAIGEHSKLHSNFFVTILCRWKASLRGSCTLGVSWLWASLLRFIFLDQFHGNPEYQYLCC